MLGLFMLILLSTLISCQSEKDKQLNEKSSLTFDDAVEKIKKSEYTINIDSFRVVYEKSKSKDPQSGLDFADRFKVYAIKLLKKKQEIEFEENAREVRIRERKIKKQNEEEKAWKKSKAGKMLKDFLDLIAEKPGIEIIEEKSPYSPVFVKKIEKAEKRGDYKTIDPKNVWGSLGLK